MPNNYVTLTPGYYERFLERGNLKDTPQSKEFFNILCDLTSYHGEEATEYIGDFITKWEKEQYDSRLEEKD